MPASPLLSTWELLPSFGFEPDTAIVWSDVLPGLSVRFGTSKLEATCLMSLQFRRVVCISGVVSTPRTIAQIRLELPTEVASREQGAAWLVWLLARSAAAEELRHPVQPEWVDLGQRSFHLLPWVAEQNAYASRPRCMVDREWLKLGLKTLSKHITPLQAHQVIGVSFDGVALAFQCGESCVTLPAIGEPWSEGAMVFATEFFKQSQRFMREHIEVSIWRSELVVGSRHFPLASKHSSPKTHGLDTPSERSET